MNLQDGYDFPLREFPKGVTKPVNKTEHKADWGKRKVKCPRCGSANYKPAGYPLWQFRCEECAIIYDQHGKELPKGEPRPLMSAEEVAEARRIVKEL